MRQPRPGGRAGRCSRANSDGAPCRANGPHEASHHCSWRGRTALFNRSPRRFLLFYALPRCHAFFGGPLGAPAGHHLAGPGGCPQQAQLRTLGGRGRHAHRLVPFCIHCPAAAGIVLTGLLPSASARAKAEGDLSPTILAGLPLHALHALRNARPPCCPVGRAWDWMGRGCARRGPPIFIRAADDSREGCGRHRTDQEDQVQAPGGQGTRPGAPRARGSLPHPSGATRLPAGVRRRRRPSPPVAPSS